MRKQVVVLLAMLVCMLMVGSVMVQAEERNDLGYFTLRDEDNQVITMTGRMLDPGDQYIAGDNRLFEVVKTEGDTINVRYLETIDLPDVTGELMGTQVGATDNRQGVVAIYHTHNAESYVPSSGTESKDDGDGDILAVGRALASAMEDLGLEVHWTDNSHIPHDGQAYVRSRRSALDLLKKNPDTVLDVHRDATPPEVYETEIEGVPTTKVRLVVGRQNQNRSANLEYAKRIKAVADDMYPNLVEGIFDARGNYNQDLGPKMILLEFGAHTTSLEQAERSAEFFAKVIPAAAGLTPASKGAAQEQIGGGANRSLLWMLAVVTVVIVGFLLISQGKIGSITGFFRREAGLGGRGDDEDDPS